MEQNFGMHVNSQNVLEYTQWRNFSKVIDKARIACKNSGYDIDDHFAEVSKMLKPNVQCKTGN